MMEEKKRKTCIRCLLRDMAEEDAANLKKYIDVIKMNDRVDEGKYEERLAVCKECDQLNEATCLSCGCYVEVRAMLKAGRCPKKKW